MHVPGKAVLIATLYFNASHRCIAQISIGASGRSELANVLCRYAEISETLEFGAEAVKGGKAR